MNLRTRKINDDNHQLKLEISTLKVQMKEQETALRHEHAEEVRAAIEEGGRLGENQIENLIENSNDKLNKYPFNHDEN